MKTNAKVYVLKAPNGALKLGHSRNVEKRCRELSGAAPLDIVHQTDVLDQAEHIERLAHRILALHGKHIRGEWFEATLEDAILAIELATRQAEGEELQLGGKLNKISSQQIQRILISVRIPSDLLKEMDECRQTFRITPTRTQFIEAAIRQLLDTLQGERNTKPPWS